MPGLPWWWPLVAACAWWGLTGFYLGVLAGQRWDARGWLSGSMRRRWRRFRDVARVEGEARVGADFRYRFAVRRKRRGDLRG